MEEARLVGSLGEQHDSHSVDVVVIFRCPGVGGGAPPGDLETRRRA